MRYTLIPTRDPALNLALEEQLFTSLPPAHPGLFLLWQNNPSVIVGCHQCTPEEVNEAFVRRENLPVVRRITGGGAVYHDSGNLNFSFIENARQRVDFQKYLVPVREALRELGVAATVSGRNDLEVEGRKISGSAQLLRDGKILHHGTLLVTVDFERLSRALTVDTEKISSKGVGSVRARVCNISEHWHAGTTTDELTVALLRRCAAEEEPLSQKNVEAAHSLAAAKYRLWDWNYGASPPFTEKKRARFPWGIVDLRLDVRGGVIENCKIFGDFFATDAIDHLEEALAGRKRERNALSEALAHIEWERCFSGCEPEVMRKFFVEKD